MNNNTNSWLKKNGILLGFLCLIIIGFVFYRTNIIKGDKEVKPIEQSVVDSSDLGALALRSTSTTPTSPSPTTTTTSTTTTNTSPTATTSTTVKYPTTSTSSLTTASLTVLDTTLEKKVVPVDQTLACKGIDFKKLPENTGSQKNLGFENISTALPYLMEGDVAWGDYNNDGFLDLLVSGMNINGYYGGLNVPITRIYRSNGNGLFSDIGANLTGVYHSSVAWGDYNNDGLLDVALSGASTSYLENNGGFNEVTKIYKNNGNNTFTDIGANLIGISGYPLRNSIKWVDYDNDGDLDLSVSGGIYNGDYYTKLYKNLGNNQFVDSNMNLPNGGNLLWADFDNDGDQDLVSLGGVSSGELSSNIVLYKNVQNGSNINFEPVTPYIANNVWLVNGDIGDYNNDGKVDFVVNGKFSEASPSNGMFYYYIRTKLYKNLGNNQFAVSNVNLTNVYAGDSKFGDYDNDGDLDLVVTGANSDLGDSNNQSVRKLYLNNAGNFVEDTVNQSALINTSRMSVAWGDYDNDRDLDLVMFGISEPNCGLTTVKALYKNNVAKQPNNVPVTPSCGNFTISSSDLGGNYFNVLFNWLPTFDQETIQSGLSYNLFLGSVSSNLINIESPMSKLTDGWRRIVSMGRQGSNPQWMIKNIPAGIYKWGVQAIDTAFAGSAFSNCKKLELSSSVIKISRYTKVDTGASILPLQGVALNFVTSPSQGGGITTTTSTSSGYYEKIVPYGWIGVVTPSIIGLSFNPTNRNYSNLTVSAINQDYMANK